MYVHVCLQAIKLVDSSTSSWVSENDLPTHDFVLVCVIEATYDSVL